MKEKKKEKAEAEEEEEEEEEEALVVVLNYGGAAGSVYDLIISIHLTSWLIS